MADHSWVPDRSVENLSKIDKETAKFYFDQSEKELKSTVDLSDGITNRAYIITASLIPTFTIILSILIEYYILHNKNRSIEIICLSWTTLILIIVCFFLLSKVIFPRRVYTIGREPKKIFIPDFYANPDYNKDNDLQYILLVVSELQDQQFRIEQNNNRNNERAKYVRITFVLIAISFLVFIIYLILAIICS